MCSLHFVGENGPTSENLDPVAATMSIGNRNRLEQAYQCDPCLSPNKKNMWMLRLKQSLLKITFMITVYDTDLFFWGENQDL